MESIHDEKRENWTYDLACARPGQRVRTIAIGVDGTCALFSEDGWRQVMVGTIAFYDDDGERIDTIYVANAPENGKATFFARMESELERVRARYPDALYLGIADGAHDLWEWLGPQTQWSILDFWHASEYLNNVAAAFAKGYDKQRQWAEEACHRLKHEEGAATDLLAQLEKKARSRSLGPELAKDVERTITYFQNQRERMDYHCYGLMGFPIGSGVTEAACKCIAKERLCGSGMKWNLEGAQSVLSLRTLVKTTGRWEAFWQRTAQYGFSKITRRNRPSAKS